MKKILIIEDEQTLLKLLSETFTGKGYEVVKAINANDALRALEQKPDIVILDILLPGESGLSVLEKMRKDKKTKEIPVVVLTNFNEPERVRKAEKLGISDYLVKSNHDPESVLEKVEEYLETEDKE